MDSRANTHASHCPTQTALDQTNGIVMREGRRNVHLMPRIANHSALLCERVERMPRDEPCRLDLVFVEEIEETTHADGPGEEAFACGQDAQA